MKVEENTSSALTPEQLQKVAPDPNQIKKAVMMNLVGGVNNNRRNTGIA
jgi:hypothetical protein